MSGASAAILAVCAVVAIDGDTLAIGKERIRIIGLDTPELHPARCQAERELGERAKARLQELACRPELEVVRTGRDRYRRTLARVYVGEGSIAEILIAEGLARAYLGGRRAPWCDPLPTQ